MTSITGPSNTGKDPVITMGPVTSPVVRTSLQGATAKFLIIDGLELWNVVQFNGDQEAWAAVALTILLSAIQNGLEKWRGRRFIGASR